MSAAGMFRILANDGKLDKLLQASALLKQHLTDVSAARRARGQDPTPDIADIEATHILFVHAHFRPYAAIGSEYSKVKPASGSVTLGSSVQFSIPLFGDFFHDMILRTRLSAVSCKTASVNSSVNFTLPHLNAKYHWANVSTKPAHGHQPQLPAFTAPQTTLSAQYPEVVNEFVTEDKSKSCIVKTRLCNMAGATVVPGSDFRNYVRYCDLPGIRLLQTVKFEVNGNPLDQYDSQIMSILEKVTVPMNKRAGFNKLHGQETAHVGLSNVRAGQVYDYDAGKTPDGMDPHSADQSHQGPSFFTSGSAQKPVPTTSNEGLASDDEKKLSNATHGGSHAATSPSVKAKAGGEKDAAPVHDFHRIEYSVLNGAQTPKPVQAPLELWVPLQFFFNKDIRLSVPSIAIPFGNRYINVDLAKPELLVYEVPSLMIEHEIQYLNVESSAAEFVGTVVTDVKTVPYYQQCGFTSELKIEKMELYINNLFVSTEIHDIFVHRIGFTLIRVYRKHVVRCTTSDNDEKLLSQLKWPVEQLIFALQPAFNSKDPVFGADGTLTSGNPYSHSDWHRMSRRLRVDMPQLISAGDQAVSRSVGTYDVDLPTIDRITVTAHGVPIIDDFSEFMYNVYQPYATGEQFINPPYDTGVMFVTFAVYPGQYQPSGHFNLSRARETYIKFTTKYVSANTPADLIVVAICLNFFLISDGSAVLRFST